MIAESGNTIPLSDVNEFAGYVAELTGEKIPATLKQRRAFIASWYAEQALPIAAHTPPDSSRQNAPHAQTPEAAFDKPPMPPDRETMLRDIAQHGAQVCRLAAAAHPKAALQSCRACPLVPVKLCASAPLDTVGGALVVHTRDRGTRGDKGAPEAQPEAHFHRGLVRCQRRPRCRLRRRLRSKQRRRRWRRRWQRRWTRRRGGHGGYGLGRFLRQPKWRSSRRRRQRRRRRRRGQRCSSPAARRPRLQCSCHAPHSVSTCGRSTRRTPRADAMPRRRHASRRHPRPSCLASRAARRAAVTWRGAAPAARRTLSSGCVRALRGRVSLHLLRLGPHRLR